MSDIPDYRKMKKELMNNNYVNYAKTKNKVHTNPTRLNDFQPKYYPNFTYAKKSVIKKA